MAIEVRMPRPIETLLSLPRVRLIDRVPILETEKYVHHFITRTDYRPKLVRRSLEVTKSSAKQFSEDDHGLSALLTELDSAEYIVTKRSKTVMENMLRGICADGAVFKGFEEKIQPLCEISQPLRAASGLAGSLADRAKEESLDVARALLIDLPTPKRENAGTH
jgi:hypothetical protein